MAYVSIAMLAAWLGGNPVDPVARAFFPTLLVEFGEGSTRFGYPDEDGDTTIGRGNKIDTLAAWSALDWSNLDGSPASQMQVQTAWTQLQTAGAQVRAAGRAAWRGGGHYEGLTKIRASQDSIDALIGSRLDEFDRILRAQWPGWDAAPPKKQEALMRLAWACGTEGPKGLNVHGWPKLHAAWVARNGVACAAECRIPRLDATEPGANALEASLFEADDGWGDEPVPETQPAI